MDFGWMETYLWGFRLATGNWFNIRNPPSTSNRFQYYKPPHNIVETLSRETLSRDRERGKILLNETDANTLYLGTITC